MTRKGGISRFAKKINIYKNFQINLHTLNQIEDILTERGHFTHYIYQKKEPINLPNRRSLEGLLSELVIGGAASSLGFH